MSGQTATDAATDLQGIGAAKIVFEQHDVGGKAGQYLKGADAVVRRLHGTVDRIQLVNQCGGQLGIGCDDEYVRCAHVVCLSLAGDVPEMMVAYHFSSHQVSPIFGDVYSSD